MGPTIFLKMSYRTVSISYGGINRSGATLGDVKINKTKKEKTSMKQQKICKKPIDGNNIQEYNTVKTNKNKQKQIQTTFFCK